MKKREGWHDSMRGYFAGALLERMKKDKNIVLITGDLGFGMMDKIREELPGQFLNAGASEQAMLGIASGMTYRGKTPVVYSITPFLLYRGFEFLRNYVDHESLPVKLVGGGRDDDYKHDGFTHYAHDAMKVLSCLPNITQYWPGTKEDVVDWMDEFLTNGKPSFMSLKR